VSAGFGVGDPTASGPQPGAGVQTDGAAFPVLPYTELEQTWSAPPSAPRSNTITINATNLAFLTIDVARARVNCDADLHVVSDGPLTIHLAGCSRTVHVT
jgi:hypothetical protein